MAPTTPGAPSQTYWANPSVSLPRKTCSQALKNLFTIHDPKTISVNTDMARAIEEDNADYIKERADFKSCKKYMVAAKEAWVKYKKDNPKNTKDTDTLNKLFDKTIDRIEILNVNGKRIEFCYNLEKVGEFGICGTNKSPPLNWGFCSRTCMYMDLPPVIETRGRWYSEADFKYYDEWPGSTATAFFGK